MPYVDFVNHETGKKEKVWQGAFSRFFPIEPEKSQGLRTFEIFPPLQPDPRSIGNITVSDSVRSLELWKEAASEIVRIVGTSTPTDYNSYTSSICRAYRGTTIKETREAEPPFVRRIPDLLKLGWRYVAFDVEQGHSLPFLLWMPAQIQNVVNTLVSSLAGRAAWIQFLFMDYPAATYFAESAAVKWGQTIGKIAPRVTQSGGVRMEAPDPMQNSAVVELGPEVVREYRGFHQSTPAIVSVRGAVMLPPGDKADIGEAFRPVHISLTKTPLDALSAYYYQDIRMVRWLRARSFPDPREEMRLHAEGGFLKQWGKGRELVPDLFVTEDAIATIVHLPTSTTLPVQFSRGIDLPTQFTPQKEGIRIGE